MVKKALMRLVAIGEPWRVVDESGAGLGSGAGPHPEPTARRGFRNRCRLLGGVRTTQLGCLQRRQHFRTALGVESAPELHPARLRAHGYRDTVRGLALAAPDLLAPGQQLLQLGDGVGECQLHEAGLIIRGHVPEQQAHLGVAEVAGRECLRQQRTGAQLLADAHVLVGRALRQALSADQPGSGVVRAEWPGQPALVELGDSQNEVGLVTGESAVGGGDGSGQIVVIESGKVVDRGEHYCPPVVELLFDHVRP